VRQCTAEDKAGGQLVYMRGGVDSGRSASGYVVEVNTPGAGVADEAVVATDVTRWVTDAVGANVEVVATWVVHRDVVAMAAVIILVAVSVAVG
jgi:hypothetical protein